MNVPRELIWGSVFGDMSTHMLGHWPEVGVLGVALEEGQEDEDCEPGITYVVMQCCGCWWVYL